MDERNAKISGSGIAPLALCPGKFNLEKGLPDVTSEAAEKGTRIHSHLAGESIKLEHDDQLIADKCMEQFDAVKIAMQLPNTSITHVSKEKRLWYGEEYSGQLDLINHYGDEVALIIDWKTGRVAQSSAAENIQLRAYAVLLKKNMPDLKKIYVAIIQPMAGEPSVAVYDEEALEIAESEVLAIIRAAYEPDAPRNPSSDACKYCKAKAICPEARGVMNQVAIKRDDVPALTNEVIAEYLEKAEIIEDLIEALKLEAKARLLAGEEIPGRKLQSGRTSRSIRNPEAAYTAVADVMCGEDFASCCKVSIPKLEKLFAEAANLKPKEAKIALEERLANIVEVTISEPIMVKSK